MRIGLVGVSLFAASGYGNQSRGICHALTEAGHKVFSIAHESDVIVWGGRKNYRYPDGMEIETYVMPSPLPEYNRKNAADVLAVYIDILKLDLLIGHWDAFALEVLEDMNVPYLCVTGNTIITLADGSHKPIKDIKVGDWVLGYDQRGFLVPSLVRGTNNRLTSELYEIATKQNDLFLTGEHPVYSEGKWIQAKNTGVGQRLLTINKIGAINGNSLESLVTRGKRETDAVIKVAQQRRSRSVIGQKRELGKTYAPTFRHLSGASTQRNHDDDGKYREQTYKDAVSISGGLSGWRRSLELNRIWQEGRSLPSIATPIDLQYEQGHYGMGLPNPEWGRWRENYQASKNKEAERLLRVVSGGIQATSISQSAYTVLSREEGSRRVGNRLFGRPFEENWTTISEARGRTSNANKTASCSQSKVLRLERIVETGKTWQVYNIHTTTNNYFANDVLVHNCYIPVEGPMTQAWYNYIKNAFKIVCYSRYGYEGMLKFAHPAKVSFIQHGINCDVFKLSTEAKAEHRKRVKSHISIPDDCFLFTYIAANVGERKQIPLLLDTFEKFAKNHDDAHLFLWTNPTVRRIGEGYRLLPRIDEPGLKGRVHVPFVNPVMVGESDEQMAELYNASDCYISNSLGEGFGVPILEAMACGIPSIGPRNSSHTELIEDIGWLCENVPEDAYKEYPVYTPYLSTFPVPDQRSLLQKMEEAYRDLTIPNTIGERCRERALTYDWKVVGPKWVELLKEVEDDLSLIQWIKW